MNRWIWPGSVAGAVAVATVTASLVGAQPVPEEPFGASETRASVVCPGFSSATATVRIAAAAGRGLRTGPVTDPAGAQDASGLHVVTAPPAPLRVSALLPEPFGATTTVSAAVGADRGLSAVACTAPGTAHWFTGVDISEDAQSEVVVANLDGTRASVDLTVYGSRGRIAAPRGLRVEGNAVQVISLGTIERTLGPVTVQVGSSDGRVAAFLRQRTWAGEEPLGADWVAETTAPAPQHVLPGVPAGAGERVLVVTNPGERTATVTLRSLTASGAGGIVGAEQLEVPAGTTRSIDLATGLDQLSGALALASTQPVTAGLSLDTGGTDARRDPALTVATAPLPADSLWPLAPGRGAATVLQLANPGETDTVATVTAATAADPGTPAQVPVPAGSVVEVEVPAAATVLVRVQTTAAGLHGALVSTARLGRVRGLAVVALPGDDGRNGEVPVVFDPHAGS